METAFTTVSLDTVNPFYVEGTRLFFLEWDHQTYLVKDYCPHRGGPLSLGDKMIDEGKIICPWHKNKICALGLKERALPMVRVRNRVQFSLEEQTNAVYSA
ncbi:MAG: Rieske (2Fe-2S) protein [Cyanobacteria bacterium P01_D01_bin.44]